jgi:FAD/FMN-containing dehydrogenase
MTNLVGRTLYRLGERLPGRVSTPGENGYAAATAIWSKPVGRMPRAVVHCRTAEDVALAIRAARDCHLPYRCAAEATIGLAAPCATASSST